jgi:2-dehydro-3-deoxyphosphogluconate aldolase / (4S)-4-hydroxy-2-oxoglutarate aldolase
MDSESWLNLLRQHRAIAVIRAPDLKIALKMAAAVYAGGMRLIEITWNSDRPAQLITTLREILPDATIGVGTITNLEQQIQAIDAGAEFIFSPGTDVSCINAAVRANIPIVPGALTPTEIVTAWNAGASCVKIFPVHMLGGTAYLQALRDPLGHIPLIPTGGITLENTIAMLDAGAIAVGLGSDLFPRAAIQKAQWPIVTQQAQRLIAKISTHR